MLSVIIPNWNGASHLPPCLHSLRQQTFRDFEIIVADNASTDNSLELLARDYPEVKVVALDHNTGFTGACNAGLRAARGDIQILLNNDTEVDPNWLAEVAAAFDRHPEAGLVASKMLLFDQRDTFHTAGDLYRTDGLPANRGVWQKDIGQFDEGMVFSACGGSAAYRKVMLDQIGLLDDDFFFSCEDVDLAWRAQLAGWKAVFAPQAVVFHKLSATGGGGTASFYDGRNFIYVLVKDVPTSVWRKHWREIIGAQWRMTLEALRAWRGVAARARLRGQLAGLLALPKLLARRRGVQVTRKVSDEYIEAILTPCDEGRMRFSSFVHRLSSVDMQPVFLSIIIPAHNEEKRLPPTLTAVNAYLDRQAYPSEIVVVENGSRDLTAVVTEAFAADHPRVRLIRESARGKGLAVRHGMLEANGQHRFICDADLSMPIEEVAKFLPPQLEGADVAIGSREAPGARRYNEPAHRHFIGRTFSNLVKLLALPGFEDTQCGFKCFSAKAAEDIFSVQLLNSMSFDVEALYIALKRGYRVVEVPVNWYYRSESRVRLVDDSLRMFKDILTIRRNWEQGKYAPKK